MAVTKWSTAICYKQKTPKTIGKGTRWERKEDTFLAYYTGSTLAEAKAEAMELNTYRPQFLLTGEFARCDERVYFARQSRINKGVMEWRE